MNTNALQPWHFQSVGGKVTNDRNSNIPRMATTDQAKNLCLLTPVLQEAKLQEWVDTERGRSNTTIIAYMKEFLHPWSAFSQWIFLPVPSIQYLSSVSSRLLLWATLYSRAFMHVWLHVWLHVVSQRNPLLDTAHHCYTLPSLSGMTIPPGHQGRKYLLTKARKH